MSEPAFDPRPLTDSVSPADANAFARRLRAEGRIPSGGAGVIVAVIVAVIVIFVFGSFVIGAIASVVASIAGGGRWSIVGLAPVVIVLVILAVGGLAVWRNRGASRIRWVRLDRFARANGMAWLPSVPSPPLPGLIFGRGSSRRATDVVRGQRPRFTEIANYRYTTGSGKNRTTHRWGYVAIKLDVPLPNIVLDATSNNGLFGSSNLPAALDGAQRLSLEGDFDRHFTLYCPRGYERDALYLFTPDIMARFIDDAAALDIEIVDDWLLLYARRDLSTLDPAMWAWLLSTVDALQSKFAQWARWRDERLASAVSTAAVGMPGAAASAAPAIPGAPVSPPPGVAEPGRRLQRGFPWVAAVIVGGFAVVWFLLQAGVFGALLR